MKRFLPILLAIGVVAGCSGDSEQAGTPAPATTSTATSTSQAAAPTSTNTPRGVGKKDPQALVETIEDTTGFTITPAIADGLGTSMCAALDEGHSLRQVADMASEELGDVWGDQNARMAALAAMLEYCPRHADLG